MKKSSKSPKAMKQGAATVHTHHATKDRLNLMVQINDPKNVRKDLLEALREIIIFMQGYEAFLKIQEEKIAVFGELRDDVKSLNSLVDSKLRRMLPKGKLAGIKKMPKVETPKEEQEEMPAPRPQPKVVSKSAPQQEDGDLDELESQLREIESRLKNM